MKMKKLIVLCAACVAFGSLMFAESEESSAFSRFFSTIQPEVGLKAIGTTGLGSQWAGEIANVSDGSDGINIGGGASLFGKASIGSGSVRYMNQIEVNLLFNNGVGNTFNKNDTEIFVSVMTLDIPILFGVDIDLGERVVLTPFVGPYISIPLAGTLTSAGNDSKLSCGGVEFGGTAGIAAGFCVGPGEIVADARYDFDFTPTKMRSGNVSAEIFTRRGIQLGIGYQMKIGD